MKKEKKVLCISVVMFIVTLGNLTLWTVPCASVFQDALNLVFTLFLCGYMFLNSRKE